MLISVIQLDGSEIRGRDGTVGTLHDLLFDSENWSVRYIEVDTGKWLPGRRVILPPQVIESANYATKELQIRLTKEQVENSPTIENDMPVSYRKERELAKHFGWGMAWVNVPTIETETDGDPNLRSVNAVNGYRIEATDGNVGHIADFIVEADAGEDKPWVIRYLIIDTRNWLPGRHVILPPVWAKGIHWNSRTVDIDLKREIIRNSPEYDPHTPINRRYEEMFYDFYGRPCYWAEVERVV